MIGKCARYQETPAKETLGKNYNVFSNDKMSKSNKNYLVGGNNTYNTLS